MYMKQLMREYRANAAQQFIYGTHLTKRFYQTDSSSLEDSRRTQKN